MTPAPLVDWGVAARPMPGEVESGDLHLVKPYPGGVLVAAVDGLGHGPEAAEAARIAVQALESHAGASALLLVSYCHERLRGTRGVAMTLAAVSARDGTMYWLGVGNVEGVLFRADTRSSPVRDYVVLRGGVVGEQLPPLRASVVPIRPGDTLILATDGIRSGFTAKLDLSVPPRQIADLILAAYARRTDDALVLVARYVGAMP